MNLGSKVYAVGGPGSPYSSKETFLAVLLLSLGYRFWVNEEGVSKAFQDVTDAGTLEREFVFLFEGMGQVDLGSGVPVLVKDAADQLRDPESTDCPALKVRGRWLAEMEPGKAPVKNLRQLEVASRWRKDFDDLAQMYADLLQTISALQIYIPELQKHFGARQIKVRRNGRKYYLPMDASESEREFLIKLVS